MTRRPPHNSTHSTLNGNERQSFLRALPSVDELTRAMLTHLTTTQLHTAEYDNTQSATQPSATTSPPTTKYTGVQPLAHESAGIQPHALASHDAIVRAARAALAEARTALTTNGATAKSESAITTATLTTRALTLLAQAQRPTLRPVINATGVIINTNLGRAPLSDAAIAAMHSIAHSYSNLEYNLERGERGSRQTPIRTLLRDLTGAEDALVVNNNAAAVLLVLATLATNREVIVSRGELVEIGGGFRVPDVMRQSGARLVEVGTTNRTRVRDFESAITPDTGLLLAVHPSNFRIVGFTEAPDLAALVACARTHELPVMHDLGSGCLYDTERWGLAHEPTVQESIAAGVDIVCFSGDKLLGGPQAGIIAGRARYIEQIERHPLMRATRIDKLTLAALEATLRQHRDGLAEREIPVWRMITTPLDTLHTRATRWVTTIRSWGHRATLSEGHSTIGGGSLPGETLPTHLCALSATPVSNGSASPLTSPLDLEALATRLRQETPAVVARVYRDQLLLDPRTVLPSEDDLLLQALHNALSTP
ncbi:MAG: L-seryl-tRNA(Sec) selenium transferase [Ktedonobacterales bacterium]